MCSIPQAIQQLRLCSAFKGYATPIMDCISTTMDREFYIIDGEGHISKFIDSADDKSFRGINPQREKVCLLAIDHKLIDNHKGGIADCALFHTNLFCFIEFKANAEGNSLHSVTQTYEEAISQIESTVALFKQNLEKVHIDFAATIEIVCHVVVSAKFPRNIAMEQNYSIDFTNRTGLELCFNGSQIF